MFHMLDHKTSLQRVNYYREYESRDISLDINRCTICKNMHATSLHFKEKNSIRNTPKKQKETWVKELTARKKTEPVVSHSKRIADLVWSIIGITDIDEDNDEFSHRIMIREVEPLIDSTNNLNVRSKVCLQCKEQELRKLLIHPIP